MTTAALLTAVAASPKPTAISRTLPGYSVMSPAAKTRCRLVRIAASTTMCRFCDLDPPLLERAEVGDEAERGDHGLRRAAYGLRAVDGDLDLLDHAVPSSPSSAVTWALVTISTEDALHLVDGALVGAERVAAVDQGDRLGDRLEVQRPVERAVAAADDDHVLAGVRREARHEELHAAPDPAVAGRQRPRAELADAGGDDQQRRRVIRGAVVEVDGHRVVVVGRGSTAVRSRRYSGCGGGGLLDQPGHQVAALDRREAGDVEDLLLGVHRGDLAAELRQRVDDARPGGRGSPRSRRRTGPLGPAPMISRSVSMSGTRRS